MIARLTSLSIAFSSLSTIAKADVQYIFAGTGTQAKLYSVDFSSGSNVWTELSPPSSAGIEIREQVSTFFDPTSNTVNNYDYFTDSWHVYDVELDSWSSQATEVDPVRTSFVKTISQSMLISQPTLLISQPTLLISQPTLLISQPTLLISQPTLLISQPTLLISQPTLLISQLTRLISQLIGKQ
ncbi:hypothetical protein [Synechococcus sp. WH 8016]|uniref:hypothetical protein n=1 Tax=Synechococcus sp. WH 8016 TaxID=166318 RepID=UPI00131EE0C7|nr:hypothetical protein [Synechococcus sp. WH 8016]